MGIAIPAYVANRDDQWLQYPLTHYSLEAGRRRVAEMNAAVEEKIRWGHAYPFERYELIPVDDKLIGEWDERRSAAT
jgi:hypothetical protein